MNKKTLVIITLLLLLAGGCSKEDKAVEDPQSLFTHQRHTPLASLNRQTKQPRANPPLVQPPTSQDNSYFLDVLTSSLWRESADSGTRYSYEFLPDGNVTQNVISDYTQTNKGRWGYKLLSRREGLLFLLWPHDTSLYESAQKDREEVLYFTVIDGNKLEVVGGALTAMKPFSKAPVPKQSKELPDIINEKSFPDYFKLTAHPWKGAILQSNNSTPDYYLFRQDGTFTARYRNAECQHDGHWALRGSRLFFAMPPDHCDTRGNNEAVIWGQVYRLEGDSLVLDQEYKYTAQ